MEAILSDFAAQRAAEAIDRAATEFQTTLMQWLGKRARELDLVSGVAGVRDRALKALAEAEKPKK